MKRQTRPFTVEIKTARKPLRPVGSPFPETAEDWADPFPDDIPVRDVREDLAPPARSDARREAERLFGGLSRADRHPPEADAAERLFAPVRPVDPSRAEANAPRILPDLFAQAREEERQAGEAPPPPIRTRGPATAQRRSRRQPPKPVATVETPEVECPAPVLPPLLSPLLPPAALGPDGAISAARVDALVHLSRQRAPRTGKLPPGQRWKERRLPRICWERDALKR